MGNAVSHKLGSSALVCGCGYVAQTNAELVHHYRTVAHEHRGSQRRKGPKRRRQNSKQHTAPEVELAVRATQEDTGERVYVEYTTDSPPPDPQPSGRLEEQQAEQHRLQQWVLDHISSAASSIGPLDEDAALGLADFLAGLLEQDVCDQEAADDTAAIERLAEQLGVQIGQQQEDAEEQHGQRQEQHELKRLIDNLDQPVSQGSSFNVLQYAVTKLYEKRKSRIQDSYFDRTCALDHASREPGNFVPRSNYLTEKVVGVKHAREVQKHVCVNDCCRFPDLAPGEWKAHADDACKTCGQARFEHRKTANGTVLVPRKVFYWFGLGNIIRDRLFTDPSWCQRHGAGRAEYFYSTAESERLHASAGCSPDDTDTSVYEAGLDWGQVFVNKVYSCGFIMVRSADMPLSHLNRRCYSHIVGIIPGPQEPKNLDPYLQPLVDEFKQYGPKGTPLRVTEHKLAADNKTIEKREFGHTILLGGVFGDSPGIKKLARWLSHAAYLGCGYCWLRGIYSGGMYFAGYAEPTSYGNFDPGEFARHGAQSEHAPKALCGDPVTHLSASMQRARANIVDGQHSQAAAQGDDEPRDPSDMGSLGVSIFMRELDYCDYNNLFVLPIAHAGLCGVVKDFWKAVLSAKRRGQQAPWYQLSNWARDVMRAREKECVATLDFGRSYSDIVSKKGNWTMEDWLHWTEAWSVVVLRPHEGQPLLPALLVEMWSNLRKGLLYFCRSNPTAGVPTTAEDAMVCLKRYAVLVEQHFGLKMCKFNLHLLVCRLVGQEVARGRVCHTTEYWVENLIQWAKSSVRYRTTKYPELVLASDMLVDWAIAVRLATVPGLRDVVEGWKPQHLGYNFTNPDVCDGGTQLLGSGRPLGADRKSEAVGAVVRFVEAWAPVGWSSGMVERAELLWYSYANVHGVELLHSTSYTRARVKVSYNILCHFYEGTSTRVTQYIARVKYFVKVSPPADHDSAEQPPVLRLAICDMFKLRNVDWGAGVVYHSPAYPRTADGEPKAVDMHVDAQGVGPMQNKHAMACTTTDGAWFVPYSNMSGTGQEE